MADELDRVRISEAELRAEASSIVTSRDNLKEVQKRSKKQCQREGKRPDLQRYDPGAAQTRRCKDRCEGDVLAISTEPAYASEESVSDPAIKMSASSLPGSGLKFTSSDCQSELSNVDFDCNDGNASFNRQHARRNTVKSSELSSTGTTGSPKLRKLRKPDREIYQPGGRRGQGYRDYGLTKELEQVSQEVVKADDTTSNGLMGLVEKCRDIHLEEEKRNGREVKEGRKKQVLGKQKRLDVSSSNYDQPTVNNITDKVEKHNSPTAVDAEKKSENSSRRRRRVSGKGSKNRTGRGEGGTGEVKEKKKEQEKRRSRGGREGGSNQASAKREEGEGGEKSLLTHQLEKNSEPKVEGRFQWDVKGKNVSQDQNLKKEKHRGSQPIESDSDRCRTAQGTQPSKVNCYSKRYSKSDIRRPRNRTYSTSSASSGTSMDGPVEPETYRSNAECGVGERGPMHKSHERMIEEVDHAMAYEPRQRRRTAKDMSSTDSFEENEGMERDGRGGVRAKADKNDSRTSKGNTRGLRGALIGGQGGVLRVSLDRQSGTASGTREDQTKCKNPSPRGRGRGILVLPTHTELNTSSEPGPRLMCGARSSIGLGRGRGSRGGSTRRLWDPNNPDKKPALSGSQQSQQSSLRQPLYLQHQGGYGPLHFLDTDDEAAGSPPVHQGEDFQGQHAATMAYYKYQNSDNPYCYPLPTSSSNTPPCYTYSYQLPYQLPGPNGMFQNTGMAPFYGVYGHSGQVYPSTAITFSPEETEVQTRGELSKLLRMTDSQELQLSNLLSRERLSREGLDRMAQLRAELLTLYESVILTDIEFSDTQNVDQLLWKNVFYQVIERFRQLLKNQDSDTSLQIRAMLLTILEEGAMFFDSLLLKLQTVFQFKLEDYMDGMAIRAKPLRKTVKYALISAQRCMICQGDVARYREQANDSANYGKARSWYLKAQQIAPKNGRPYNQLAVLAVYTKRKLDAVYYYMRSLAASNPILTAKESLMSLFEEAKRKAEQIERRMKENMESGTRGPRGHGTVRSQDATRVEIWIRPSGHPGVASRIEGSESGKDSEQDGGLRALSASDLNKRFVLSFLHTHGKLFTKVGMESFPAVATRMLEEFRALLQHSPSPLGSTRMLQIITVNMFTVHYAQTRDKGQGEARSVLEEQSTSLGLAMFGLLVQRCTELLKETPAEPIPLEEVDDEVEPMVRVSSFTTDLRELLPSVKVWSDWMLGHPEQWNPPPCNFDGSPDVWQCLADLCNSLASVYHGEIPLFKADADGESDELRLLVLEEDRMLAGFVPLLAAPQEPCYIEPQSDTAMAADCKRVTVLKYFLEALCGQEEPLLAFKGGKYVSIASLATPSQSAEHKTQSQTNEPCQDNSVIIEETSLSTSEGEMDEGMDEHENENDIRELRARRYALVHKLAEQQKRRDKIKAVLQTGSQLELEIRPFYLVPDTNCFIDHLEGLKKLLACGTYILVVPLIVITELDGLAKGQECRDVDSVGEAAHARLVQECAKAAVAFLEKGFEAREPGLRALTSRGNQLESIAFRSEDTSGQKGNNDDVILSCCLHYCQDKAKDFMPAQRDGPVRLHREVVLLTDDRNLRVKALTRNVPVRDIPAFLSWAKVG
ncbi:telomerase-binding protein EST1A isoform X1 [Pangasianodon hypophthalmus]|uniref:telomerase-binding protein EST1A isoform X1 n=2 Tax=Pangasianodon hypophthalmus TaxID=310915 RepID=UPI00230776A7|nr:telomerase-binding protein EST1A isoform X1 [Pangasianodon hypophthalmus]